LPRNSGPPSFLERFRFSLAWSPTWLTCFGNGHLAWPAFFFQQFLLALMSAFIFLDECPFLLGLFLFPLGWFLFIFGCCPFWTVGDPSVVPSLYCGGLTIKIELQCPVQQHLTSDGHMRVVTIDEFLSNWIY
jgi:hypothetical protein